MSKSTTNLSLDHVVEGIVERKLATVPAASRWMRAADSPLGRRLVCRLVQRGVIKGAKPSKHLLVDRAQHDAWIASHPVEAKIAPAPSTDDDLAALFGVERGRAA